MFFNERDLVINLIHDGGGGGGQNPPPPPPQKHFLPPNNPSSHLCPNLDSFSKLLSGTLFPGENVFPAAAAEEPAVL